MTEPQRSELLHRINAGDADALQSLLIEYHPSLRVLVAQRLPHDVAALAEPEDVLQLAYISAFQALARRGEDWRMEATEQGSAGILPAHSGSAGISPAHSGSAGIPPAHSGSAGIPPAHSGSAGIPPAHSGSAGIPPAHSGSAGIPPAHSGSAGIPPAHSGSAGIPPAHSGSAGILPAIVGRALPADSQPPPNVGRAMPADPSVPADSLPSPGVAQRGAPTFPNPAAFYKWLEFIVLHDLHDLVARLHRRKRDVRRVVHGGGRDSMVSALQTLAAVTDSTPSRALARDEAAALLLVSLARLTEDQRAVVRLRFFEERPVAAVAAELHKSEDAVHALTYRALKELRRMLEGVVGSKG